jgi:hypothetical protein
MIVVESYGENPGVARKFLKKMAGTTGLEPAASAVTGQRSNQLNYVPTPGCDLSKPHLLP